MKMFPKDRYYINIECGNIVTYAEMLEEAQKKGLAYYGVSEHFDYDYDISLMSQELFYS